ncbi:hypothetical protein B0H13DRAFT_2273150 [Mycena leptocephala]|nr:hypothetical protein B0H13DRAFT_2273150 [Mycena leptocephala]
MSGQCQAPPAPDKMGKLSLQASSIASTPVSNLSEEIGATHASHAKKKKSNGFKLICDRQTFAAIQTVRKEAARVVHKAHLETKKYDYEARPSFSRKRASTRRRTMRHLGRSRRRGPSGKRRGESRRSASKQNAMQKTVPAPPSGIRVAAGAASSGQHHRHRPARRGVSQALFVYAGDAVVQRGVELAPRGQGESRARGEPERSTRPHGVHARICLGGDRSGDTRGEAGVSGAGRERDAVVFFPYTSVWVHQARVPSILSRAGGFYQSLFVSNHYYHTNPLLEVAGFNT